MSITPLVGLTLL